MKLIHVFLALLVVATWGLNFVFIKFGLSELPPLFLSFARFALAAVPGVFLLARPKAPWSLIVGYGLAMFALQFGLLFAGMQLGVSAGLASLVLQMQVFITIALAMVFMREKPKLMNLLGAATAFAGIVVIATHSDGEVSGPGLIAVLLAATCWAAGNLLSKRMGQQNTLSLVVWGSLVAAGPLLLVSLWLEGAQSIMSSLEQASWVSVGALAYIVYPTTLMGFAIWSYLLSKYPTATVAPMTLLVPVFGMLFSHLLLAEALQSWKLAAAALVIAGLLINMFGHKLLLKIKGV